MSKTENTPAFRDLAEELGDEVEIRISVRAEGDWIDRETLGGNEDDPEREYVLAVPESGESRFRMKLADTATVTEWRRFVFPIRRRADRQEEDHAKEVEIVVELTTESEETELTEVPWNGLSEILLSSMVLERGSGIAPVNADRVAGLDDEKHRLKRFLTSGDGDWGVSESSGLILEGPPGTGKTELMMEVCQELYGSMPVMISGPEILSKWVGESERMLREKFDEAWSRKYPVLYIDELDAIARARSDVSESYSAQIVAQLLVLLDGVESKQQSEEGKGPLKVVASTNLSHVVDPALRRPGRLGNRPIRFGRPNEEERFAILHHYLENVYSSDDGALGPELEAFVTKGTLAPVEELIALMEGFTGADIEDLVQESVSRLRDNNSEMLQLQCLEKVLEKEGFDTGRDFEEHEIPVSAVSDSPMDGSRPELVEKPTIRVVSDDDKPEDVAKQHFSRLAKGRETESNRFLFRTVGPKDLLATDPMRAKENTVEAFQHREDERISLYIENLDRLHTARAHSSLVERLIGVIHEQFLQWENENQLLIDSDAERLFGDHLIN